MLSLICWIAPAQIRPIAPDDLAEQMWAPFRATDWLSEADVDRQGVACRDRDPEFDYRLGLPDWSRVCITEGSGYTATWGYYADDWEHPASRLSQYRGWTADLTPENAVTVHGHLRLLLERRYGPGREAEQMHEWYSASWQNRLEWRGDDLRILLFIAEPLRGTPVAQPPQVHLLVRHDRLAAEWALDRQKLEHFWRYRWALEQELDELLITEIEPQLPKTASLLRSQDGRDLDPGRLRTHIHIVLRLAEFAPLDRQPVYLLAADRLATRLAVHIMADPKWTHGPPEPHRESAGLSFDWAPIGGGWGYRHDLLRRVWREFPDSPWGERAFVLLQSTGWYTGASCPADPALFLPVIAEGEKFLAARPATTHAMRLNFLLAAAYDTWFAHPPYEQGVDPRAKAIDYYERVIRLAPDSTEAFHAKRQLPRLKLGLSTYQSWFYCIYD